jgi:channel protein (hemolysin III family)
VIPETIALGAGGAVVGWVALKLLARAPALLTDVKPCRGNWAEARLRGCQHGIAHTGIPVEPFNVFSNVAYLAAGWVTYQLSGDRPSLIFSAAMTLLFFGSTLYHGLKAMWAARLDHAGIYAVFAALAVYAIAPAHPAIPTIMAVAATVAAIGFAFVFPGDLNARMGLLLLLMAIRAFLLGSPKLAVLSLVLFGIAYGAWNVDIRTTILSRFGHAIWHLLTAGAMAAMFLGLTS